MIADLEKGSTAKLDKCTNPYIVADILKLYLSEMDDPLMTYELFDCWVAAIGVKTTEASKYCTKKVVRIMPPQNYAILKSICGFFYFLHQHSAGNKMTASLIAEIFAPILIRSKILSKDEEKQYSKKELKVVQELIEHYPYHFEQEDTKKDEELDKLMQQAQSDSMKSRALKKPKQKENSSDKGGQNAVENPSAD